MSTAAVELAFGHILRIASRPAKPGEGRAGGSAVSGYPTLAERLTIAHSGGRNGAHPGFPPPDEPRAITAALQAIYESARGNANGARNYAKLAVRLVRYAALPRVNAQPDFRIFPRPPADAHAYYAVVVVRKPCYFCGEPFGFNVPIYRDPLYDNELTAHLSCAIERHAVTVWTPAGIVPYLGEMVPQ